MPECVLAENGLVLLRADSTVRVSTPTFDRTREMEGLSWRPLDAVQTSLPGLGAGPLTRELALAEGARIVREVFAPAAQPHRRAVRLVYTNSGGDAVALECLSPVVVRAGGLRLGGAPCASWTYIRQPRHKNDMPAAIRLGDERPGAWDAVRGTPETGGAPSGDRPAGGPARLVSSEATVLAAEGAAVLFGIFPLHEQFVSSGLILDAHTRELESFRVDCLCDGQLVPAVGSVASQWVLVDAGPDPAESLRSYALLLLAASDATPGGSRRRSGRDLAPPTVWCSWYYWGDGFSETEAEPVWRFLERERLPVDVVQIDECWDTHWGDWQPNARWRSIATVAHRLRAAGYEPGIWTCPFLAGPRSDLRYAHPEWLLKNRAGAHVIFQMGEAINYVLDPTHPGVREYLRALYVRLTREWGFSYHKLDFTRAVGDPEAVFHDRSMSRAQAYRSCMSVVREAIGPDSYLNVCGGFYGPLVGLADAQRTGSDVKSIWPRAPAGEEAEGYGPFTIKQNSLRFWMNALWDNDPDALMVRRRSGAHREEPLSLGLMSDEEALTSTLNQYLGGGLVCFTENLPEIEPDRLLLLAHCAPSIGEAAVPLDLAAGARFPALFRTEGSGLPAGVDPWVTVSVVNWHDEARTFPVLLDHAALGGLASGGSPGGELLVGAFRGGWVRRARLGETLLVGPVAPHGCEVLKVQWHRPERPQIARTDGHFSMGAAEVRSFREVSGGVDLSIRWEWPRPLGIWVTRPSARARGAAVDLAEARVQPARGSVQRMTVALS